MHAPIRSIIVSIALLSTFAAFSTMTIAKTAAQFVVIASNTNNNQIPAGKTFKADHTVKLVAGESVTLLSQGGQVINLQGPYAGPINKHVAQDAPSNNAQSSEQPTKQAKKQAAQWPSTLNKLTKLVTKDSNRTAVVGASRMVIPVPGGSPDMTNDFWFMDVDSSGHRCVRTKDVLMWRDNPNKAIKIDLRSQTAKRIGLMWQQYKYQMPLPNEFIQDGELLVMKLDKQPRRFDLHVLPTWIKEKQLGNVLLWMVNRNCTRQSQKLINTLQAKM